jgi:hypothetical protein
LRKISAALLGDPQEDFLKRNIVMGRIVAALVLAGAITG